MHDLPLLAAKVGEICRIVSENSENLLFCQRLACPIRNFGPFLSCFVVLCRKMSKLPIKTQQNLLLRGNYSAKIAEKRFASFAIAPCLQNTLCCILSKFVENACFLLWQGTKNIANALNKLKFASMARRLHLFGQCDIITVEHKKI